MQETDFVPKIIRVLEEEDVPPGKIALEITESFMIEVLDPIIEKLGDLKKAGFMLALDDFGKGYSSLSYLRTLPVNYIKIDKTFIDDILSTTPGIPLARTIIELSHQLGLKVVAEGVEVVEQIAYLKENGCDLIQGFYYSKPGTEDTVLGQLKLSFD
jgi:EAL domain-containing protein (putative c-di-GMP-specific phosphodiesterase class I)